MVTRIIMLTGFAILVPVYALAIWRLLRGPAFGDRLAAFHVAGVILALGTLLLAARSGSRELMVFVALLVPALLVMAIALHKLSVQGAPSGALAPLTLSEGALSDRSAGKEHADG